MTSRGWNDKPGLERQTGAGMTNRGWDDKLIRLRRLYSIPRRDVGIASYGVVIAATMSAVIAGLTRNLPHKYNACRMAGDNFFI